MKKRWQDMKIFLVQRVGRQIEGFLVRIATWHVLGGKDWTTTRSKICLRCFRTTRIMYPSVWCPNAPLHGAGNKHYYDIGNFYHVSLVSFNYNCHCYRFFTQFWYKPTNDKTNVNLIQLADKSYATTDSSMSWKFDLETLETETFYNLMDQKTHPIPTTTAHPHYGE